MKIKALLLIFFFLLLPAALFAQNNPEQKEEEIFKARVVDILEQKNVTRDDGSISTQQKLKLKGLGEDWKDKEIIFDGIGFDVLSASEYKVGDKVLVNYSPGLEGEENFYVIGFSRTRPVYWLVFLFALIVTAVGRLKGFRALIVLLLTFLIILKFIVPKILSGSNPLLISIIGSFFILILAVYITEGFKRTSTVAIFSILISLIITGLLSVWFSAITKLTGFASEEAAYLIELSGGDINIKGLLLAGIIIGALGVLDDVIISQVALVKELRILNPQLAKIQIYRQAMRVGISHLSSMVNTLFLAYAGASLPLLILFSVKQPPFLTFNQVIDNEMIATEIVRTFTGSIGLVLAVPIATFLAVQFIKNK
ncbi:MAG: YibE/F family protein [Patescibacteria group bacterium]|nr:YibE/F family protein [Patescibacteria group bacterium]MDD5490966.1 YibE/F family protein [Patescibacteria group bacterium]